METVSLIRQATRTDGAEGLSGVFVSNYNGESREGFLVHYCSPAAGVSNGCCCPVSPGGLWWMGRAP